MPYKQLLTDAFTFAVITPYSFSYNVPMVLVSCSLLGEKSNIYSSCLPTADGLMPLWCTFTLTVSRSLKSSCQYNENMNTLVRRHINSGQKEATCIDKRGEAYLAHLMERVAEDGGSEGSEAAAQDKVLGTH